MRKYIGLRKDLERALKHLERAGDILDHASDGERDPVGIMLLKIDDLTSELADMLDIYEEEVEGERTADFNVATERDRSN